MRLWVKGEDHAGSMNMTRSLRANSYWAPITRDADFPLVFFFFFHLIPQLVPCATTGGVTAQMVLACNRLQLVQQFSGKTTRHRRD